MWFLVVHIKADLTPFTPFTHEIDDALADLMREAYAIGLQE